MRAGASVVMLLISVVLAGRPAVAQQSPSMIVPVAAVDNPQQLVSLNVVDPSGGPVGDVVKVKTGSDGKATRVMVMLSFAEGSGRVAAIRPERLSFDRRQLVLVAQYSAAELRQLAATATTPNGIDLGKSSGMVQRPMPSSGDASPPMGR